jgi:RNA polymerase sigma-70 factor (ECF subfamily)
VHKKSGMELTFEEIYKNNYRKLYTLAFRMTGSKEDTEDIIQTSFLNAYKAFEKFRYGSSVYTWLYKIALNEAKRFIKNNSELPVDLYAEENDLETKDVYNYINSFGTTEDDALVNMMRETCLQMFMNCMPSKYRVVYTLRIILQFTVKETSEILEISESSVKTNLNRAKKILKNHFDGRCSLVKKGEKCNCRSFAKYMHDKGQDGELLNIEVINMKEKKAVNNFYYEIKEILEIDDLYNTEIKPVDYSNFLERIKKLRKKNKYQLLKS